MATVIAAIAAFGILSYTVTEAVNRNQTANRMEMERRRPGSIDAKGYVDPADTWMDPSIYTNKANAEDQSLVLEEGPFGVLRDVRMENGNPYYFPTFGGNFSAY